MYRIEYKQLWDTNLAGHGDSCLKTPKVRGVQGYHPYSKLVLDQNMVDETRAQTKTAIITKKKWMLSS